MTRKMRFGAKPVKENSMSPEIDQSLSGRPKYSVVFLLSIARSGSTLFGRMLDMHPEILCVGEMLRLADAIETDFPCSCGKAVVDCDFWKAQLPLIQEASDLNYRRYTPELYKQLGTSTGHPMIVDLSKTRVLRMMTPFWHRRRWDRADTAFVFLLRDPRGVSASAVRGGQDLGRFLPVYKKWMRRFDNFIHKRPERSIIIRYEDLCRDPEQELKRFCTFCGIDFDPQMLCPADQTHHFLHSSRSGYLKNINELKLDERWRRELDVQQLTEIENVMKKIKSVYSAIP